MATVLKQYYEKKKKKEKRSKSWKMFCCNILFFIYNRIMSI